MTLIRHQGGWVIVVSILLALMLEILPLPHWAQTWRPEWAALVVLYWAMALPQRVGVGVGWLVGLFLDMLNGTLLGQHALAMAVIAYLAISLHLRIRVYPLWQQAFTILVMLALYQLLILWFDGITGEPPKTWNYWGQSLSGTVLWPWIFVVLRDVRRRFRVT